MRVPVPIPVPPVPIPVPIPAPVPVPVPVPMPVPGAAVVVMIPGDEARAEPCMPGTSAEAVDPARGWEVVSSTHAAAIATNTADSSVSDAMILQRRQGPYTSTRILLVLKYVDRYYEYM